MYYNIIRPQFLLINVAYLTYMQNRRDLF